MAEKDISEKILADYNDVFADIINAVIYKGEPFVREYDFENAKDKSMYKADGKLHEQERDVAKYCHRGNTLYSLFGLEHNTKPYKFMPVRIIGYDGAGYRAQLLGNKKESETIIFPVVTIVLYFGLDHWTTSRSLYDCMNVPKELKNFVNDYKIHVVEVSHLTDEELSRFRSDFRIVADYFVQMRKNKNYIPTPQTIKHVDEVLKLMSVLTEDNRFELALQQEERSVSNMCEALDMIEKKGIAQGRLEQLQELVNDGLLSAEVAASKLNISVEEFLHTMDN